MNLFDKIGAKSRMYFFCSGKPRHVWPSPMTGRPQGIIRRLNCSKHPYEPDEMPAWYEYWVTKMSQELADREVKLDAKAKRKDPRHMTASECRTLWEAS